MRYRSLTIIGLLTSFAVVSALAGPAHAIGRIDEPGVVPAATPLEQATVPGDLAAMIGQQVAGVAIGQPSALQAVGIQREVIAGDVAHYTITVRTGPAKYDVIRVHRIVRESRSGVPIRTARNLFYQHGDLKDFVGMMAPGLYEPSLPRDFGLAMFLARNDVDVWGIDQDWTLVPDAETDLSFMSTWGLGRATRNLELGVAIARALRLVTGSGGAPMLLSGYSSGGYTAAAMLDHETQLPALLRQVNGYVNVDIPLKPADPGIQGALGADLGLQNASIASGQYGSFLPFKLIAQLATAAPDDPSPIFAGFTNYQVAAYITIAPGGTGWPAPIHYWAGNLDETGFPTGPRLTTTSAWLEFLGASCSWQPVLFFKEYDEFALAPLGGLSSPFDQNLRNVRVPVFNISPGGGLSGGTRGGMSCFGSTDVQEIFPTTGSPAETDLGHVDLFTWPGSQDLVWRPMLNWINTHSAARGSLGRGVISSDGLSTDGSEPGIASTAGTGFGIQHIASNPVSGPFGLSFMLPCSAPARLELLDIAGRIIESQEIGGPGAGVQQARIGGSGRLTPGIYLVRLSQAGRQWSQRVAVVK